MSGAGIAVLGLTDGEAVGAGAASVTGLPLLSVRAWGRLSGARVPARAAQSRPSGRRAGARGGDAGGLGAPGVGPAAPGGRTRRALRRCSAAGGRGPGRWVPARVCAVCLGRRFGGYRDTFY